MAFLCVCPEKSVEFGEDAKLQRSAKEQFICGVLESVKFASGKKATLTLPGGGIAVQYNEDAPKIAIDVASSTLSALTGTIQNYAYLVKKYLQNELQLPAKITLEAIRELTPVTEAKLLCKLYAQMGTGMIVKLRGHFSFCIYDATTVRVLAGTDCSGAVPLAQGKLSDNSLFIASENVYPGDAHDIEHIPVGHYKYGWHAPSIKFANAETDTRHTAEVASFAADMALVGLFCKTADNYTNRRRFSLDSVSLSQSRMSSGRSGSLDGARIGRYSIDSTRNKAGRHDWQTPCYESPTGATSVQHKSSTKATKKHKKRPSGSRTTSTPPSTAEEFINTIGGPVCEDIASLMERMADGPHALAVIDSKDGSLVFVNKFFEKQTGYSSKELYGKHYRFLQTPPNGGIEQSTGFKTLRHMIERGLSGSTRLISHKKNGTRFLNNCSTVPLRDLKGKVTHVVEMHHFESEVPDDRRRFL